MLFQIIYWDNKAVYMEHRFITPKDDFVRAIAICQQRVITCNAEDIMKELLGIEAGIQKPEIPLEVAKWIECNEISSANLRNGCWQKEKATLLDPKPVVYAEGQTELADITKIPVNLWNFNLYHHFITLTHWGRGFEIV